jgi:hypothetical protein
MLKISTKRILLNVRFVEYCLGIYSFKVRCPWETQLPHSFLKTHYLYVGNQVEPIITMDADKAKDKAKAARVRTVNITVDDSDLVNFVTGG